MKIVSLDVETASTKTNALILEIGMISGTLPDKIDVYHDIDAVVLDHLIKNHRAYGTESYSWGNWTAMALSVSILEQRCLIRNETEETYAFHKSKADMAKNLDRMLAKGIAKGIDTLEETLTKVRLFCKDADELWINGLSFDPCILKTLCEDADYKLPLWKFRIERDIRTIYRTFNVNADLTGFPAYDAVTDCARNLLTLRELSNVCYNSSFALRGVSDPEVSTFKLIPILGTTL